LSDSKAAVAERAEILNTFADCADPQRAWLLLEDYFEKLSLSRKDFDSRDWWPRVLSGAGKKRLEETAILFLRASRPLPTELLAHASPVGLRKSSNRKRSSTWRSGWNTGSSPARPAIWIPARHPAGRLRGPGRWSKTPRCTAWRCRFTSAASEPGTSSRRWAKWWTDGPRHSRTGTVFLRRLGVHPVAVGKPRGPGGPLEFDGPDGAGIAAMAGAMGRQIAAPPRPAGEPARVFAAIWRS